MNADLREGELELLHELRKIKTELIKTKAILDDISKEVEGINRVESGDGWLISGGFVLVRVFLILGALFYMWQVRHPKTE